MIQLAAYLSYNGNCAEAMSLYAQVLGAKVQALITYGQMPEAMPVPPEHRDKVMHAHLVHPDFELMAGDVPPGQTYVGIQGAMMAITFPTVAEARRVFEALSEGGQVTMPLGRHLRHGHRPVRHPLGREWRRPGHARRLIGGQRCRNARLSSITGTRPTSTRASAGSAASPSRSSRASW